VGLGRRARSRGLKSSPLVRALMRPHSFTAAAWVCPPGRCLLPRARCHDDQRDGCGEGRVFSGCVCEEEVLVRASHRPNEGARERAYGKGTEGKDEECRLAKLKKRWEGRRFI
jgi:hypothetical protein